MTTYIVDCYITWDQYLPLTIEAADYDAARHIAIQLLHNAERPAPRLRKGKMVVDKVTDNETGEIV